MSIVPPDCIVVHPIPPVGNDLHEGNHVLLGCFRVGRFEPSLPMCHLLPRNTVEGWHGHSPHLGRRLGRRIAALEMLDPSLLAGT